MRAATMGLVILLLISRILAYREEFVPDFTEVQEEIEEE